VVPNLDYYRQRLYSTFSETYSLGIIIGFCIGKPLGILSYVYLSIKLKLTKLPKEINWNQLLGSGFLGGIEFIWLKISNSSKKDLDY